MELCMVRPKKKKRLLIGQALLSFWAVWKPERATSNAAFPALGRFAGKRIDMEKLVLHGR